jgi:hypothetical protein
MTVPYWDFMGSTMVTNNYVRLTPDSQSKQGLLWNSVVCKGMCIVLIIVDLFDNYIVSNTVCNKCVM